ncbi:MAG: phosphatidylglycerophosphatase A family protein [bacterium]
MNQPNRRDLLRSPVHFFAFGFGVGFAPRAPGTCGALVALPFVPLLHALGPFGYGVAVALAVVVGVRLCARAADALEAHDHPAIVWDEMVGLWIALAFIPLSWSAAALGFALFRLFDIAKPWPISLLDRRVGGGLGIMLDDIAAGVLANLALRLLLPLLP